MRSTRRTEQKGEGEYSFVEIFCEEPRRNALFFEDKKGVVITTTPFCTVRFR